MRASFLVAALLVSPDVHAHTENRSSCMVDTVALDTWSMPKVRVMCEIPVASEAERSTLTAALRSLVQIYAEHPHGRWRKDCTWTDEPHTVGHHSDAMTFEAHASCPDSGSLKMDLAYLSWHPAPHVAEISIGDGRERSTSNASADARKVTLRGGPSTRLFVGGCGVGLGLLIALVASIRPERSPVEKRVLQLLVGLGVSFFASNVLLHW